MKLILEDKQTRILRFDPGEEVISKLISYCIDKHITGAWLTVLGACKQVELWYYCLDPKEYEKHIVDENLEVLTITGNIGMFEGQPIIHAHGSFSNRRLEVIGGHVNSLVVSATMEVRLEIFQGEISREFNDKIGLKLMSEKL